MWGASVFHDRADQKQPQDPNVCHVSKSGGALTHPIAWNRSLGALWSTYYIRCPSLQSPIAPVTLAHGQCYKLLGFKPYLWWFSQGFTFSDSQHIIIIRLRFTIQILDFRFQIQNERITQFPKWAPSQTNISCIIEIFFSSLGWNHFCSEFSLTNSPSRNSENLPKFPFSGSKSFVFERESVPRGDSCWAFMARVSKICKFFFFPFELYWVYPWGLTLWRTILVIPEDKVGNLTYEIMWGLCCGSETRIFSS